MTLFEETVVQLMQTEPLMAKEAGAKEQLAKILAAMGRHPVRTAAGAGALGALLGGGAGLAAGGAGGTAIGGGLGYYVGKRRRRH